MNTMSTVMAAVLIAALFVSATLSVKSNVKVPADIGSQGLMPEVVVTAEMPRLVMPTVDVHAFRTVAMSNSVYNVN